MKELVQIQNLIHSYEPDHPPAVKNLNLLINEGEYISIIGPNGCGKTTLIRHLNALLLPSSGEIKICGLTTQNPKNHLEIRRRVGMVFQNPDNQIVGMSVEEDVAFGPGNLGLPAAEVRYRVDHALEIVGLDGYQSRTPHSLSGGQKQLLAIAGLLAMDPRLIILDEPTSSLDPAAKNYVLSLLQKLKCQGIAIIHITHSMDEAAQAERVIVMNQGSIIADGKPVDILCQVDWLKSLGLAPPQLSELMWQLQQQGEDVNTSIFNIDDAVKEIAFLLKRLRTASRKAGSHV